MYSTFWYGDLFVNTHLQILGNLQINLSFYVWLIEVHKVKPKSMFWVLSFPSPSCVWTQPCVWTHISYHHEHVGDFHNLLIVDQNIRYPFLISNKFLFAPFETAEDLFDLRRNHSMFAPFEITAIGNYDVIDSRRLLLTELQKYHLPLLALRLLAFPGYHFMELKK